MGDVSAMSGSMECFIDRRGGILVVGVGALIVGR